MINWSDGPSLADHFPSDLLFFFLLSSLVLFLPVYLFYYLIIVLYFHASLLSFIPNIFFIFFLSPVRSCFFYLFIPSIFLSPM